MIAEIPSMIAVRKTYRQVTHEILNTLEKDRLINALDGGEDNMWIWRPGPEDEDE